MSMNFAVFVSEDCGVLREIMDGCREYRILGQIAVVIGDCADGKALQEARNERIPAYCFSNDGESDNSHQISEVLQLYHAETLIVTDCRRKLSPRVLESFAGRVFYIVPSSSPEYIGTDLDEFQILGAVLAEGATQSAITVYRMDATGNATAVAQKSIRIYSEDSPETLAQRMRFFEPEFIGSVVADLAEGKLTV